MWMIAVKVIRKIYRWMQRHYLTFRFLVWLKEFGITRRVNHLVSKMDKRIKDNQLKKRIKSQAYFCNPDNSERLIKVENLLADKKSRETLLACIEYRVNGTAIPNHLFSEYDQYFVKGIIELLDEEVFIDAGAYTGDTLQQLLDTARMQKKRIKKIVAFEPDEDNYQMLSAFYGKRTHIILRKQGVADSNSNQYFISDGVTARVVSDKSIANSLIETVSIDSVEECADATFIKMDIEGAEWEALHGAEGTIKRNRPKLAICIYHSDDDMLRLIEYIHGLVPEYKLYVRHHSRSEVETVLYAII
jgi:FkbM family methyltransferase